MMNKRQLYAVLLVCVSLFSCGNDQNNEIKSVVNSFYNEYDGNFTDLSVRFLSIDFAEAIHTYNRIVESEEQSIKKSSSPTDKADMFDCDILSSVGEKCSYYKIKKIVINADRASVYIECSIDGKVVSRWNDELLLVRENGWKIDNVIYDSPINGIPGARELLNDFIVSHHRNYAR